MNSKEDNREMEREFVEEIRTDSKEMGEDEFWNRLFGPEEDYLPMVSELKSNEIPDYLYATWFAQEFEQDWLERLVKLDLALRVSVKRRGRKEAVQAMTGSVEQRTRRLFSLRRGEG